MANFVDDKDDPSYLPPEPPKKPKIDRTNVSMHLVEYQLAMVGKTLAEAKDNPLWYSDWTMTTAQHEEFKKYAIPLLKKVFKYNTKKAQNTFDWFNLQFGLRIKD
ncbi:MAG: hypothetical protein EBV27_08395 [Actinobacteria bacterium]|nr:hypothetical protein [Actinomycetota bacterium]